MSSQKGITLTSLVIYIGISTIVISIMAVISSFFFKNVDGIKKEENYPAEFNKFNMFFINDVKQNKTVVIDGNKITFEDGTVYKYSTTQKTIVRNNTKIASNVTNLTFSLEGYKATENTTKNIVTVNISIGENFSESIEYVLKYW